MTAATLPVLFLLLYNGFVLFGAFSEKRSPQKHLIFPAALFFFSGMPALVYQIVWQRALFAIYGVNSESVAVVVSAFMIGLGSGSLLGGWLSQKFPERTVFLFGVAEVCVGTFGIGSLRIFHWAAAHSAGTSLPGVVFFSLILLLFPTVCMGATLPMLAEHLVRTSHTVGYSIGLLYFANTFGSAIACYLCATFLLRDFGQSGSVRLAACVNFLVAVSALCLSRARPGAAVAADVVTTGTEIEALSFPFSVAMVLAALIGFISLGLEIVWFRVFSLASSDRAAAFALLLSTYLAGIAAGSYVAGKITEKLSSRGVIVGAATVIVTAAGLIPYLTLTIAWLSGHGIMFSFAAPAFFLVAALLGSIFTLTCRLVIPMGPNAGRRVSLLYVANIVGSAVGSLLVGFVLLDRFGLQQVNMQLALLAFFVGLLLFLFSSIPSKVVHIQAGVVSTVSLLALLVAPHFYTSFFERIILGLQAKEVGSFAKVVENRNGVIAVTDAGAVFGGGVYDGYFNTNPVNDKNLIVRAYAVSAFHPAPSRILMIGLSSGSWAQVLVNNPFTTSLEIVEINPGYLRLIPQYPSVQSLLKNSKVRVHIDDGRRWLLSHPDARYDVIVQNTSFYWRDHVSTLLSRDYLRIIRAHLEPGGVFYYNTTGSDDVLATGLSVFPFGLRVVNFLAVSDSPVVVDKKRWFATLSKYRIDGEAVFDFQNAAVAALLENYMAFADSLAQTPFARGMESSHSIRARVKNPLIITDDNMGWEWRDRPDTP